ncbi:uncharacterized protein LOC144099352 [Amblyomma americanum]
MSRIQLLPVLTVGALHLCFFAPLGSAGPGPNKLQRETPDVFKMFSGLIDMVAVRDVNPDPMFKCLTARRIQFDAEAPSATYLWFLHAAEDKETERVAFHFTPGNTSGTTRAIVDSDTSHPVVARFPYTDYSSCGVLEQNYFGYQCTLWVSDETKDSISPECLRQYEDICGESVSLYDKNICDKAQE